MSDCEHRVMWSPKRGFERGIECAECGQIWNGPIKKIDGLPLEQRTPKMLQTTLSWERDQWQQREAKLQSQIVAARKLYGEGGE